MWFFHSAQGRYQPRAAERTAVRRDHDFQPTPHDITSSGSSSRSLSTSSLILIANKSHKMYRVFFSLHATPASCLSPIRCCLYHGLHWPRGSTILESQYVPPKPAMGWPRKQEFPNTRLRLYIYFQKTTHAPARFKTQHEPHSFVAKQSRAITEMKLRRERREPAGKERG